MSRKGPKRGGEGKWNRTTSVPKSVPRGYIGETGDIHTLVVLCAEWRSVYIML